MLELILNDAPVEELWGWSAKNGIATEEQRRAWLFAAFTHNRVDHAIWLLDRFAYHAHLIRQLVCEVLQYGYLKLVKAVAKKCPPEVFDKWCLTELFGAACRRGNVPAVAWLTKTFPAFRRESLSETAMAWGMAVALDNGHLELAKHLQTLTSQNLCAWKTPAFCFVCENGNVKAAEWFVANNPWLDRAYMHEIEYVPLFEAARMGHQRMVQWLVDKYRLTRDVVTLWPLKFAAKRGKAREWLQGRFPSLAFIIAEMPESEAGLRGLAKHWLGIESADVCGYDELLAHVANSEMTSAKAREKHEGLFSSTIEWF